MTPMSAFVKAAKAWGFTLEGYPPGSGQPGRLIDPQGRSVDVPWSTVPEAEAKEFDPVTQADLAVTLLLACWERTLLL